MGNYYNMKTYQVSSTLVLSLLLGSSNGASLKTYYRPPSYSQISSSCGCNCEAPLPAYECTSCCTAIEAPVVEEDPYEVEAEKMTNTIWESVSKMEDKEVRRDNAERTAAKLREIEDAEDQREN